MRIELTDPLVFEKWREHYADMSDEEHIEFCNAAEAMWPTQKHFDAKNFDFIFHKLNSPTVLEVGGWKGELAHHCLSKYKIARWDNVDFCSAAAAKTVDMGSLPYNVICPTKINWFSEKRHKPYDVFVSAHTIEHLSDEHLVQLLDYITGIPMIMLEAPINMGDNDWRGYCGTHILKMGWKKINAIMAARGYQIMQITNICYLYLGVV